MSNWMSKIKTPPGKVLRSRPVKVACQWRGSSSLKGPMVKLFGLILLNISSSVYRRLIAIGLIVTPVSMDEFRAIPEGSLETILFIIKLLSLK